MPTKHLEPGQDVTVELVANANGNVATDGDIVEVVGETESHTQVALVATAGEGDAILDREPEEYDPSATYSANDVVGTAKVLLRDAVDWVTPSDSYTPTVGDKVVAAVGGTVRAYDPAGGDTADTIFGKVWGTHQRGTQYTAGDITVVRE